jgi:SAM-dependent methyltransferase
VIAVEPDPRMRQLIRRHAPQARVVAGRAESLPLEDASVDIVLVCSAWHWMDPDLAVPEIARVLRGGGVWGVLWNSLDREVPWVAQLRRVAGQPHSSEEENRRRRPEHIRLPFDAPFGAAEMRDIRWTWNITREHLLGLVGTYSSVIALDPREQAEVLAGARDLIDTLNLRPGGRIPVPMACRCWKAIRI